MKLGLTPKQAKCLAAIKRLTMDGVSPSYEELRAELNVSSKSNVFRMVNGLKARGAIGWQEGAHRSLYVIHEPTPPASILSRFDTAGDAIKTLARNHGRAVAVEFCRRMADQIEAGRL